MITETCNYITFKLGHELFAIDVEHVREVLEISRITNVPTAPAYMRGVVNVRGKAIPVVDLRGGRQRDQHYEDHAHRQQGQRVLAQPLEDRWMGQCASGQGGGRRTSGYSSKRWGAGGGSSGLAGGLGPHSGPGSRLAGAAFAQTWVLPAGDRDRPGRRLRPHTY